MEQIDLVDALLVQAEQQNGVQHRAQSKHTQLQRTVLQDIEEVSGPYRVTVFGGESNDRLGGLQRIGEIQQHLELHAVVGKKCHVDGIVCEEERHC